MNLSIQPPAPVGEVLSRLEEAGYEAWCVGGCVRDSLLGTPPFDWDVTTNARPEETKACFPGARLVEIGAAHGTIALVLENGQSHRDHHLPGRRRLQRFPPPRFRFLFPPSGR